MRQPTFVLISSVGFAFGAAVLGTVGPAGAVAPEGGGQSPRFDVCDVTYLWPVPTSQANVDALTSADDADDTSKAAVWPEAAFNRLLEVATSDVGAITHPSGNERRITVPPAFRDRKTWKVVGFRADGGAPGGHSAIVAKFGASPQLRLIMQPVTVDGGQVTVHDFAAHLVYNFVKAPEKAEQGFLPVAVPDQDRFRAILDDLNALKAGLKAQGIDTQGMPLGVHPGLKSGRGSAEFSAKVKAFLKKNVSEKNLTAMAFMGLPSGAPEPWIFVATGKNPAGGFDPARVPALGFKSAQMIDIIDGDPTVFPPPLPTNRNPISNFLGIPLADRRGVSTAPLFARGVDLAAAAVVGHTAGGTDVPDPGGAMPVRNKDIPDLVANPRLAHFFNTDCVSCHTESTRRAVLKIGDDSAFHFQRPDGVSGVDSSVVPRDKWNVRNLGWFPSFFDGTTAPTVSMRTANETADCVEFINRVYFGSGS